MPTAPKVLTPGQMKDLVSALGQSVPSDLPFKVAENWLGRKGELGERVGLVLSGWEFIPPDINLPLTYEKLGMTAEYEAAAKKLAIPSANSSLWMPLMVPGVTPNKIVAGYRSMEVQVYTYRDDLDAYVEKNDRDPNRDGAYYVGFRRTIEADEENRSLSATVLAERKHRGDTLCERLLLGFGFFVTTGLHLDVKTWTLCAGSRSRDGGVPGVRWYPGVRGVDVGWCYPGYSCDFLRSRSAQFPLPVEPR